MLQWFRRWYISKNIVANNGLVFENGSAV